MSTIQVAINLIETGENRTVNIDWEYIPHDHGSIQNNIQRCIFDEIGLNKFEFSDDQPEVNGIENIGDIISYMDAINQYGENVVREYMRLYPSTLAHDVYSELDNVYFCMGYKEDIVERVIQDDILSYVCSSCWNEIADMVEEETIYKKYIENSGRFVVIPMENGEELVLYS